MIIRKPLQSISRTLQHVKRVSFYPYSSCILFQSRRNLCAQLKDTEPQNIDNPPKKDGFELIYKSNYYQTVYGVKCLSITGCLASLVIAPLIIFNPLHFALLATISTVGKCFLGIPIAMFGVGTSYALHCFTRAIVTQMFHNPKTDDIKLQFVTIYLKTVTRNTNLKHMTALNQAANVGMSNVNCTELNKQCFINPEEIPQEIADKLGFNDDSYQMGGSDDTSWMGKQ